MPRVFPPLVTNACPVNIVVWDLCMNGRTCALARTCFITFKLYRTDASFGLLAMKKRQNRSVILPCPGEIYVVFLQAFQGKCKEVDHWWSLYIISLANLHYMYIYICVYIYIYRTCLLRSSDTWPFSLHILLPSDGHTELPPTQPQRPTPSDFKRWEYCHKYKLLARLCPCHESKICRIMPTSGPPSTSATAASLSRRLVWRRRAESDSHSDGAQKYMCSNRSNSTWWLIPLSKWVIFWLSPGWVGLIHLQLGYNPLAKWDEPPSNILWSRAALLDWVVANSKYGNVKSSHQAGRGART